MFCFVVVSCPFCLCRGFFSFFRIIVLSVFVSISIFLFILTPTPPPTSSLCGFLISIYATSSMRPFFFPFFGFTFNPFFFFFFPCISSPPPPPTTTPTPYATSCHYGVNHRHRILRFPPTVVMPETCPNVCIRNYYYFSTPPPPCFCRCRCYQRINISCLPFPADRHYPQKKIFRSPVHTHTQTHTHITIFRSPVSEFTQPPYNTHARLLFVFFPTPPFLRLLSLSSHVLASLIVYL